MLSLHAAFGMMAANQRGVQAGAETIGNTIGDAIDDAAEEPEWRHIEWQVANRTVVSFWVNQQRIYPNKHSIEEHAGVAWLATNCYYDHGAFMVMRSSITGDFYLPCREEDGTVRLTVWKRESATSKRFHLESAYTPKDGVWKNNARKYTKRNVATAPRIKPRIASCKATRLPSAPVRLSISAPMIPPSIPT